MRGAVEQRSSGLWALARKQHGVIARGQLLELGFSAKAIECRLANGRLHRLWPTVYAVGRPDIDRFGRWMAAVLACGTDAVLSHSSAAGLWGIASPGGVTGTPPSPIEVTVPVRSSPRPAGIVVHRRDLAPAEIAECREVPATSPLCTLVDLAAAPDCNRLEAAVNQADKLDLIDPEQLRADLAKLSRHPGVGVLKRVLDRRVFRLTDSELERRFLALVRAAGLPAPETGRYLSGFKVDFFWPPLRLVVETDGLRYHRTAAQQARDRRRDQAHTAAGLTPLRFTHAQVRYDPGQVRATLEAVIRRLDESKG